MSDITPFKDKQRDDALDRIYKAWLAHNTEDLEYPDICILVRMEYIDARLQHGGKRALYKNLVEDAYEYFKKDQNVSRRTIESDIARTKRFFLVTRPRTDRDYAKGMDIAYGERMLAKFEKQGKGKEWNALYKELNKLKGHHDREIELPRYDEVQPPPLMVVMDPSQLNIPVIDNLDEEIRILSTPKSAQRNTDTIEDAEATDVSE